MEGPVKKVTIKIAPEDEIRCRTCTKLLAARCKEGVVDARYREMRVVFHPPGTIRCWNCGTVTDVT